MAKKKHHAEEHVNHERWLVSYADMITLLMVLFVVLYAMGQTDKTKLEVLRTSLQRAFSVEVLRGTDASSLQRIERRGDDPAARADGDHPGADRDDRADDP